MKRPNLFFAVVMLPFAMVVGISSNLFAKPVNPFVDPKADVLTADEIDAILKGAKVDSPVLRSKLDDLIKHGSLKRKRKLVEGKIIFPVDDPLPKSLWPPQHNISIIDNCNGNSGPGCKSCTPKPRICHKTKLICTYHRDGDRQDCHEEVSDCIEGTGVSC